CDGPGYMITTLNFVKGVDNRPMLFAEYGLVFPMCSPNEAANGRSECLDNGGGIASSADYGRDGSTSDSAMFAYPGSQLWPPGSTNHLDRHLSEISRIH